MTISEYISLRWDYANPDLILNITFERKHKFFWVPELLRLPKRRRIKCDDDWGKGEWKFYHCKSLKTNITCIWNFPGTRTTLYTSRPSVQPTNATSQFIRNGSRRILQFSVCLSRIATQPIQEDAAAVHPPRNATGTPSLGSTDHQSISCSNRLIDHVIWAPLPALLRHIGAHVGLLAFTFEALKYPLHQIQHSPIALLLLVFFGFITSFCQQLWFNLHVLGLLVKDRSKRWKVSQRNCFKR